MAQSVAQNVVPLFRIPCGSLSSLYHPSWGMYIADINNRSSIFSWSKSDFDGLTSREYTTIIKVNHPYQPYQFRFVSKYLWWTPHFGEWTYHVSMFDHYWLVVDLPLWKMMEFVSWGYDIPNIYIYIYICKVIIQSCSKPPTRSP